jgi:hypothetical protein
MEQTRLRHGDQKSMLGRNWPRYHADEAATLQDAGRAAEQMETMEWQ